MELYLTRGGTNSLQPDEALHLQTAHTLARLGLAEYAIFMDASYEQLLAALQDSRWERRASAATALGKSRVPGAIAPLMNALNDEQAEVRAATARALGYMGRVEPLFVLVTALHDPIPLVREAAATALGKVGASAAIVPLVDALNDEDAEVRAAAAQALGYGGDGVPLAALIAILSDEDVFVREAAAESLGMLGRLEARLFLLSRVQDEEMLVRDAIAHALFELEQDISQHFISALFQEQNASVQQIAGSAVNSLIDLGLNIHTEIASIAPLVVALQGNDRTAQKAVMCYLIGRALDVLQEHIPLAPLVHMLGDAYQETATRQGVWNTMHSLTQETLRERKFIRLLLAATHDRDATVRTEIGLAVDWLIQLALTLHEEKQSTEHLQIALQDSTNPEYRWLRHLIRRALTGLEEREPLEPLLAGLNEPEAQKRAEVGKKLSKRAKKALMGRIPGGALIISLKNTLGLAPVELEFSDHQEKEEKNNRPIFPWRGSTTFPSKLPSKHEQWEGMSPAMVMGNMCSRG